MPQNKSGFLYKKLAANAKPEANFSFTEDQRTRIQANTLRHALRKYSLLEAALDALGGLALSVIVADPNARKRPRKSLYCLAIH